VRHTGFPDSHKHFPSIALTPNSLSTPSFIAMKAMQSKITPDNENVATLGKILPIIDTIDLLERVISADGVEDIQLRFKDTSEYSVIVERIKKAQALCTAKGVKLWINDHWKEAIECGKCFGIHLGQEDLESCVADGGLERIRAAGLALGISTHSYSELSAALGVCPSYISLGPIFPTLSKDVKFDPQGLETIRQWRKLISPTVPLVAIGGISDDKVAKAVREAGADCVAVIGAVTGADDIGEAVKKLNEAMS
jgi:thiamine-phosphate diphosphorylase